MVIYADTNIYGRLFDNRTDPKVNLEAEAILIIFKMVNLNKITLVSSDILKAEIFKSNPLKQIQIGPYLNLVTQHINQIVLVKNLAQKIKSQYKIAPRDAMHISSAILGKAQYFLTCDQ